MFWSLKVTNNVMVYCNLLNTQPKEISKNNLEESTISIAPFVTIFLRIILEF